MVSTAKDRYDAQFFHKHLEERLLQATPGTGRLSEDELKVISDHLKAMVLQAMVDDPCAPSFLSDVEVKTVEGVWGNIEALDALASTRSGVGDSSEDVLV